MAKAKELNAQPIENIFKANTQTEMKIVKQITNKYITTKQHKHIKSHKCMSE